jgi:hypothetical protein
VLHGCRSAEADAAAAAKQAEGGAAATKLRAEANLFAEMKRADGELPFKRYQRAACPMNGFTKCLIMLAQHSEHRRRTRASEQHEPRCGRPQ